MTTALPVFSTIHAHDIESQLSTLLTRHREQITTLLKNMETPTWETLMAPLEKHSAELHNFWSPISHLHNVKDSEDLRTAYLACLPKLSEFSTWLGHHHGLFEALHQLKASEHFNHLDTAQQTIINNELRDYKLAGIDLSPTDKERYATIATELSTLSTQFEANLLDTTDTWQHLVTDQHELEGLPERFIKTAKRKASECGKTGWLLTLDAPSYITVMQHAKNSSLREKLYHAYCTRASDQGPHNPNNDNSRLMHRILTLNLELSQLLGFNNTAEYSLATKMIDHPEEVLEFIDNLLKASQPQAQREFETLQHYAQSELKLDHLNAWDIAYASEQYRHQYYDISDEMLRPYFPASQVIQGLMTIAERLFHLKITECFTFDSWHDDVQCYQVTDQSGNLISYFYLDLYARNNKRGGAWMDDCRNRHLSDHNTLEHPVTFVTCNFMPPSEDTPALLSHDDVVTLFHEFGHATQHMLTQINYLGASGITGIPWDAVEVASQFLENYAWQEDCLQLLSKHYQTGESLPTELFAKMQRAKDFQSAMGMIRQLEFSLFDFRLHMEFDPEQPDAIQACLDSVRSRTSLYPLPKYNRFQHGFSHIFAGGYSAGYYSYKWAEVMAADIFSVFEKNGHFDPTTAQRYKDTFLALGGSIPPLDIFIKMCGRKPSTTALLNQLGIAAETTL